MIQSVSISALAASLTFLLTVFAGISWLAEPVQIPLGAVLILALLPTMELSNLLKSYLDRVKPNTKDEQNGK